MLSDFNRIFFHQNRLKYFWRMTSIRYILPLAAALALGLIVLRFANYNLVMLHNATEWYAGLIALLFLGLGIWMTRKLQKPRTETVVIERTVALSEPFVADEKIIAELGLKPRELEVLQLMTNGLSNAEIAEALFLSVNTIKTHVAGLFSKLEVNSRTKAIDQARKLRIIA